MSTSAEQINALIGNYTDLKDYFEGQKPTWDADVAAAQAAYGALSSNLKGVVASEMYFSGTVDPDNANPTNIDGGTFLTLKSLVDAAPPGAYVLAYLQAGKSYEFDAYIELHQQYVYVHKTGVGDDPILTFGTHVSATHNNMYGFAPKGMCGVSFYQIDIRLPTVTPDLGLPWSSARSVMQFHLGLPQFVGLGQSKVTGGVAETDLGVMSNNGGGQSHLGLWSTTLDGPIMGVVQASSGVSFISRSTVTLLNGALENSGATLGTNLLKN